MTRAAIRAVLLDLDGTLVDSVADIAMAIDTTLGGFGLPALGIEGTRALVGKGARHLVGRALEVSTGVAPDDARIDAVYAAFMPHYRETNGRHGAVYDGVVEGLTLLQDAGLSLACVTNKPRELAVGLLEAMKLTDYFDCLVGGGDTARSKPDPEPVLFAYRQLGVDPLETIVIGDSANDAESARRAGCDVWLVPYGYREGREIETIDCDWVVANLRDAAQLLTAAARV